jgi:predicted AlkP superfamily phosphohydrolase/phosphomutase
MRAYSHGGARPSPLARFGFCALATVALVLLAAGSAAAYVGPGAGFAVLSSFLTLFLAFLYSVFAFLTWPLRQLLRLLRRRRAYRKAKVKRVVILGFDGMDPQLAERFMKEDKLPNLSHLRETGTFRPLGTTVPPVSPVAWSSFLTGVNPGKHNIYDFLAPDRKRYLPELSSAKIQGPKRTLRIGPYAIPLGRPQIKLLRKGIPFWHFLADAGVFSSVIRVPITFPPEKFSGVLLSGMCVPDLKGSQGTFSFHTTRSSNLGPATNRVVVSFEKRGHCYHSYVPGPENTLRPNSRAELRAPFQVKPDSVRKQAEIQLNGRRFTLRKGEYSDWVELEFKAGLRIRVHGICRFYLKSVTPDLELYATPVNIHPMKPALPVSHPLTYSVYLAKLNGLYATLGLAEDTWALNDGFLDEEAFLEQCYLIHEERERMFFDALEKTSRGACICVFDITDRVQHMFWRYLSDGRASAREQPKNGSANVIEDLYQRMDDLVGRTLREIENDTLLLVISDHGFKAFKWGVNLNTWLHQQGYLSLKESSEAAEWFENVDWTKTTAYAFGLTGIYLNMKTRESLGTVEPGKQACQLKKELREKLQGLVDTETGRVAIRQVFDSGEAFSGPYKENAPDLIIGFGEGYRASWDSVQGRVTKMVFEVNAKAWSGDHCIDPDLVPGVLFSNWKITADRPAITDIAPTVLELFGVGLPPHMDGRPWSTTPPAKP